MNNHVYVAGDVAPERHLAWLDRQANPRQAATDDEVDRQSVGGAVRGE